MNPRNRETIVRRTETEKTCEGCGCSMLDTWSKRRRVNGEYYDLCTTCRGELYHEGVKGLRAYIRARARFGDDVNEELL